MTPNLFHYATSELSQDAFLCWLLAWADEAHAEANPPLHRAGALFARRLLEASGVTPPESLGAVQVERQYKNIDLLALVGERFVVVVEDKVHTSQHSGQLARYKEIAAADWPGRELAAIYLKTGDQADTASAKAAGFAPFMRSDLLAVLHEGETFGVTNAIFLDFLRHLQRIEDTVQSYQTRRPAAWKARDPAWKGFYQALQRELGEGGWHDVPNPSGGFMGFYWWWRPIPGGELYLQLEEASLCVKVHVEARDQRGATRNRWSRRVLDEAKARGVALRRPSRFGSGRYMTVAHLDGDYRQVGEDGRLDFAATVATLREAMALAEAARGGEGG
ncbi:MAG: hypothetical protein CMH57_06320 [Myxococcales bacterium]|nr:hypothetical protein [Myxococcales bacterium]